ncbi:DUF4435 domain-containing protein [Vibrio antiquarius]|uniref:DUF4435 domain-containing protein n=1 Tax=Vibrio parahaemolyticus TaxID=670 RepID=UPI0003F79340|nr:DUF4435 domain-containing protein [Vibrio parahaemolyticus]EGQ9817923.1 DUF4435 domain-containing protein [Vibrio parahaemolyticus]EJL6382036.1 DUF4435 domain-containing protein [Vibrio parahaemolyticus]
MDGIPKRSDAANKSIGLFYRELQEIEIYVEDVNAEALYTELLTRATEGKVKIKKVISLAGREKVVETCKQYEEKFPALFIVDGDLDLLHSEREGPFERLYQHRLYCLENYLFCENASAELLRDSSGRLLIEQARNTLEWDSFVANISPVLLELFKAYAVSWKALEGDRIATVSRSYHTMCVQQKKPSRWGLCSTKVQDVIDEIKGRVLEVISEERYQEIYDSVSTSIDSLSVPLYAVSGKDYLLKALREHLAFKGASYSYDDGFKFKLARYCDTEPLTELSDAIMHTVNKGPYLQAQ